MATIHANLPFMGKFDELCDSAFGLNSQLRLHRSDFRDLGPLDAPFTQRGSSQGWLAAEAGRLYSLYPSEQMRPRHGERIDGSSSPPFSETSTLRIEHEGVEELSTLSRAGQVQRRDSWVRRSWGLIRRVSSSVIGVLPKSLPSIKWNKTAAFVDLETDTMQRWESQGGRPVYWWNNMEPELRLYAAGHGSMC